MRVVFMGTPDIAVPALDELVNAGHDIVAVYSQPPRPAGRGKKLRPSPVQARAQALGLEVRHPVSLKAEEEQQAFKALNADVAVVAAYGLILPKAVLEGTKFGCFNMHTSLLPRWRGAAPIQRAIMAGDNEAGVCAMLMEAGLDTGPICLTARTPIASDETAASLHDRLAQIGAPLMREAIEAAANGTLSPVAQPNEGITYAAKIDKSEARIDWQMDATELDRHIRGLSPFPGAWCALNGERLKILLCTAEPSTSDAKAGTVLDDALLVKCGKDALRLLRVQRAGKGPMDASDLLRGMKIEAGDQLS